MTLKLLVVTALLAFVTAGASGCGEDRSNLIPTETARQIELSLTGVEKLAETDCFKALTATKAVQRQVERLPASVDGNLKRSLLDGVVALQVLLQDPDKCKASETTTEPAETETDLTPTGDTGVTAPEEEAPEEDKNSDDEKEPEKKDSEKKPQTPTPAPTPEPAPTPTPETPPNTDPPVDPGPGSGGVSPNQ